MFYCQSSKQKLNSRIQWHHKWSRKFSRVQETNHLGSFWTERRGQRRQRRQRWQRRWRQRRQRQRQWQRWSQRRRRQRRWRQRRQRRRWRFGRHQRQGRHRNAFNAERFSHSTPSPKSIHFHFHPVIVQPCCCCCYNLETHFSTASLPFNIEKIYTLITSNTSFWWILKRLFTGSR